jgi:hypothetical protein
MLYSSDAPFGKVRKCGGIRNHVMANSPSRSNLSSRDSEGWQGVSSGWVGWPFLDTFLIRRLIPSRMSSRASSSVSVGLGQRTFSRRASSIAAFLMILIAKAIVSQSLPLWDLMFVVLMAIARSEEW